MPNYCLKQRRDTRKGWMNPFLLVLGLMTGVLFILLQSITVQAQDLDVIHDYVITVEPDSDGSLNIIYHIEWEVLDSESDGPLTWIKVGIPNKYVEDITALSDTIDAIRYYKDSGDYVRIDLDRSYSAGEVVDIDFSIHQHRMYEEKEDYYLYFFTPGWFTDINVQQMEIFWRADSDTYSPVMYETDGYYNSGTMNLGHNQRIRVEVQYDKDTYSFSDDYGEAEEQAAIEAASNIMLLVFVGFPLVLVLYLFIFRRKVKEKDYYNKHSGMGRHYYHNHIVRNGSGHHSGGGCACACACACAGGGRAGCATKEFYMAKRFHIAKRVK